MTFILIKLKVKKNWKRCSLRGEIILCKISQCFQGIVEKKCLPVVRSMKFRVQILLYGFITPVSITLILKNDLKRCCLWRNAPCQNFTLIFRNCVKLCLPGLWCMEFRVKIWFYEFITLVSIILRKKKWLEKVLFVRKNAPWQNLAVFSRNCEKLCLPGVRSMIFRVQILLYGFMTLVSISLKLKNDFKTGAICMVKCCLAKSRQYFQELWKTLPSQDSKYEIRGTDIVVWFLDACCSHTESEEIIG